MEDLLRSILEGYELPKEGLHGPAHWVRVSRVGMKLAKATAGADQEVVHLFALFHDSRRENEDTDPDHGMRGAELAGSMRGTQLMHLNDAQFELLRYAVRPEKVRSDFTRRIPARWEFAEADSRLQ